ncbi:putative glycosyltransferase 3 [Abeliophyllum distichum]|uniref:Glycosyltransferase 3 n=1 Tax=Abeliophyllum distichum TaxID=126358 RepID=A0ABD1VQ33_9LAMI
MGSDSTFTAQKRTSTVLPTTTATANGGVRGRANLLLPRGRQIHKTFNNIKITIICGLVTILVLRGTIGFGNLVSTDADTENQLLIEETNRILSEIRSDRDPTDPDDQSEELFNPNVTYSLGPKINSWDKDRRDVASEKPGISELC